MNILFYIENYLILIIVISVIGFIMSCEKQNNNSNSSILTTDILNDYIEYFNETEMQEEETINYVSNADSYDFLKKEIPLFAAPDSAIESTYYFRWWTFRKHLKETPAGFVWTEFILPVSHDGNYNTISSALGHHINEARWMHSDNYLDQYIAFWLIRDRYMENSYHHSYSSWLSNAVHNRYLVNGDTVFLVSLINELDEDWLEWERRRGVPNGMFWQYDVRDAMEESISGSRTEENIRPTINSYMYGRAKALSTMAEMVGNDSLQTVYEERAENLRELVHEYLWNEESQFFEVMHEDGSLANVREAIGFIPWYFNLPYDDEEYAQAWLQINDEDGFDAPMGLTTAERRHPDFRSSGIGTSEWDGAIWPYATTQTLKGLANLLTNYENHPMTKNDYYRHLHTYAATHEWDGEPFIGEYYDEVTNEHLHGDRPRSVHYNHSGYVDLIINDLIGLKPQPEDDIIEVHPLLPDGEWDWFCLENVLYRGRNITVLWDETGDKFGRGAGFRIFADGEEIHHSDRLEPVVADLPPAQTWRDKSGND